MIGSTSCAHKQFEIQHVYLLNWRQSSYLQQVIKISYACLSPPSFTAEYRPPKNAHHMPIAT